MRTVTFVPGSQPRYKRKLSKNQDPLVSGACDVCEDGKLFIDKEGWEVQKEIKYLVDPRLSMSYVTTAALANQEIKLEGAPEQLPVKAHEMSPEVAGWLGATQVQYAHTVRAKLFLLPDGQKDVVKRLTILPHTLIRVIDSKVPAIALGRPEHLTLIERRNEDLGLGSSPGKPKDIDHRVDEILKAAKMAGMSLPGLARAEKMVRERFRDMWRTTLGKTDVANVPPLELEIKGDVFRLPKPYMRRYSPAEITWWREKMAELVKNGIFRPTNSGQLSPSNLIKKVLNGEVLPDDFRMVVDMRSLNKMLEDLDFPLPKLDEIIHMLQGAKCFASADNTKGYWQFPLAEASKRYTGFVSPAGTYEHN